MTTQTSIRITLNGVDRETPRGSSVLDLVTGLGAGGPGTAVALNDTIVRRDDYSNVILSPGDRIEVIQAVGGGLIRSSSMLKFGDFSFRSRLIVGTGKYPSVSVMKEAIEASGADLVTVAIRRIDLGDRSENSVLGALDRAKVAILPNTAGCYSAKDAILTAQLAREALGTPLIKLEVIGDEKTLFPDNQALIEAARVLVKDGFTVLPYTNDDPIACRALVEAGCPAVMPLGAPIGSGLGIRNPYNLRIILETVGVPVIVDAGVGTASDAAIAMELGCDAVLMNTAIAGAREPVKMAHAMRLAVEAGRLAFEAGRIGRKLYATASSPLEGVVGS